MGLAIGDIARTPEDFQRSIELIQRIEPSSAVDMIGHPGNTTYVARDESDRSKIVAVIQMEHAWEIRNLIIEPDYQYKEASFNILHCCMEMNLRSAGVEQYYFTAEKNNDRAIKIFKRNGADIIDANVVRFRKRL